MTGGVTGTFSFRLFYSRMHGGEVFLLPYQVSPAPEGGEGAGVPSPRRPPRPRSLGRRLSRDASATRHTWSWKVRVKTRFRRPSRSVLFHFLATLLGLCSLSSLPRDRTGALAVQAVSPYHWPAREVPSRILNELGALGETGQQCGG